MKLRLSTDTKFVTVIVDDHVARKIPRTGWRLKHGTFDNDHKKAFVRSVSRLAEPPFDEPYLHRLAAHFCLRKPCGGAYMFCRMRNPDRWFDLTAKNLYWAIPSPLPQGLPYPYYGA